MKRIYYVFFILALIISFFACTKTPDDGNEWNTDVQTIEIYPPKTIDNNKDFISCYEFKKFYIFEDTHIIERDYKEVDNFVNDSNITLRAKVVGFFPDLMITNLLSNILHSEYSIKILEIYSDNLNLNINFEEVYNMGYIGTPERQVYRIPKLEIGKEYIILNVYPNELINGTSTCMWLELREFGGVEYVYPFAFRCSSFNNNIEISDIEEANIYKEYKDMDVIEYMKEHDIVHPRFEYKFELGDFISQVYALRNNDK